MGEIDDRAPDGSTPLMVACSNIPWTVKTIKLLCERNASLNLTNGQKVTALQIAMKRKPDLEVIRLLVGKGADLGNADGDWQLELMTLLFKSHGGRMVNFASNEGEAEDECPRPTGDEISRLCCYDLVTDEEEIA